MMGLYGLDNFTTNNLNKKNLGDLVKCFHQMRNHPEQLIHLLGTVAATTEVGTVIIHPKNPFFRTIMVTPEPQGALSSIVLYGDFDLDFEDLVVLYEQVRKVYVPYDDQYEYFFEGGNGTFLKTFSGNIYPEVKSWRVSNLQVYQ